MPSPEQLPPDHIPDTGTYGEATQLNDVKAQAPQGQSPLGQAQHVPQPQANFPDQPVEKAQPNLIDVGGVPMNLDEVLLGHPDQISGPAPQAQKLADVFDAMLKSSPSADVASLAQLARSLDL